MNDEVLIARFVAVCMEIQEEHMSTTKDQRRQKRLGNEFEELKKEILRRMKSGNDKSARQKLMSPII